MTVVDLIKSVMDASKERLKTPISGAFLWSFILYNWRPIAELFFSKVTIEDRIYIINQEYCTPWAIIIPLGIAFVYTIGVPMLMVKIDNMLSNTKKLRIHNIYESKGYTLGCKIELAKKEFELKNIESGNKQITELQDQINTLEESKSQINEANKNTVELLNEKLKESNDIIKSMVKNELDNPNLIELNSRNQKRDEDSYIKDILIGKFSPVEKAKIREAIKDGNLDTLNLSNDLTTKLAILDIISAYNKKIVLTELGKKFIKVI